MNFCKCKRIYSFCIYCIMMDYYIALFKIKTISPFKVLLLEKAMSSSIVPRLVSSNFLEISRLKLTFVFSPKNSLICSKVVLILCGLSYKTMVFFSSASCFSLVCLPFFEAKILRNKNRDSVNPKPPKQEQKQLLPANKSSPNLHLHKLSPANNQDLKFREFLHR